MAWQSTHKLKTKQKILSSAATLFTHNGFDKVSINDVMKHASLTRGAFYAHFKSKADLYQQALLSASNYASKGMQALATPKDLKSITQLYLSKGHRDTERAGCPLAFLITDINQQDEQVKQTYTEIFKRFITHIESYGLDQQQALKHASTMIGGMALSRALTDLEMSNKLLEACQTKEG